MLAPLHLKAQKIVWRGHSRPRGLVFSDVAEQTP